MDLTILQRYSLALLRASRAWRRLADSSAEVFDLSEAVAYPLLFISRLGGGMRQATLAEHIGIEGPSLVRLLDQLCGAGLVTRVEDSSDKRAKTLHLTAHGVAVTARLDAHLDDLRMRVFAGVSEADIAASLRVFAALEQAAALDRVAKGGPEGGP